MNGRLWPVAHDAAMRADYGAVPIGELAERFGRTVSAVHNRANRLGLAGYEDDTFSLNIVCELLGVVGDGRLGKAWVHSGLLKAKVRKGGRGRWGRTFHIAEPDLIAFLQANPHLVDRDDVQLPYRQYVLERWMTLPVAFRRGAAHPVELEHACHSGAIPEARKRGVRWVIPESAVLRLIEGRRRWTDDVSWRAQVMVYDRSQRRSTLAGRRKRAALVAA